MCPFDRSVSFQGSGDSVDKHLDGHYEISRMPETVTQNRRECKTISFRVQEKKCRHCLKISLDSSITLVNQGSLG